MIGKSCGFTSERLGATTHPVHPQVVGSRERGLQSASARASQRIWTIQPKPGKGRHRSAVNGALRYRQHRDAPPPIAAKVNEHDSIFCRFAWSIGLTASSGTTEEI